jgi:serine/threonine protein kinase
MPLDPHFGDSLRGVLLGGRYRVLGCIGSGSMGAVFEASHANTGRRCAVKVMLPDLIAHGAVQDRLFEEARVTSSLESDHIVEVLDAGLDAGTKLPFLVMELLRGESLQQRLERVGRLDPFEVVACLHQAAIALDRAHAAGVVHRDLKPANLFLAFVDDRTSRIKLLDFGIAKLLEEGQTSVLATRGVGTPHFMAPEQIQDVAKVSPATDVYALGMIAFALLAGSPYFRAEAQGGGIMQMAIAVSSGPVEPASARARRYGATLPPAFDAWFGVAAAPLPARRFRKASEAVMALADALGLRR